MNIGSIRMLGRALTVIAFGLVMLFGLGITVGDVVPNESLNDKVEHVVAFLCLLWGFCCFGNCRS